MCVHHGEIIEVWGWQETDPGPPVKCLQKTRRLWKQKGNCHHTLVNSKQHVFQSRLLNEAMSTDSILRLHIYWGNI